MMTCTAIVPRLLVVGGNGYLGSAVCKAAVGKGWEVSSMSSSGKPYTTPAGHTPKWVNRVQWHRASAFDRSTYAPLVGNSTAVVHTLGILLEDEGYKASVQSGDIFGLIRALTGGGASGNPLKSEEEKRKGYDGMNRDSALNVLDTVLEDGQPRSFIYVSAADAFRPLVPKRYIESKREAEREIARRCLDSSVSPAFIRPGLMYHPHVRPLTTFPAFALSLTASAHDALSSRLPFPFTGSPSYNSNSKSSSPFGLGTLINDAARALGTHPIHVDHVADAIVRVISEQSQIDRKLETFTSTGAGRVVDVDTMRRWAGFPVKEREAGVGFVSGL